MIARTIVASLLLAATFADRSAAGPEGPFRHRGYYMIPTRYPTAGLDVWKSIVDDVRDDGGNLIIYWVSGGFKSRKFPETWAHNADHENVKADFTRELIDHAHARGIKVLLGFSPFAYDGVNRHTLEHPDLGAIGKDGKPAPEGGIFGWGRSLCPAREGSRRFMLDYAREMAFDFYPNADGLFIESTDYGTCQCPECGPKYYDNEYKFVRAISDEAWAKDPKAMIVVYPHYFSGEETSNEGPKAVGARQALDPRWTLFFTPHSTKINADLIKKAKDSLYWDPSPIFGTPAKVRDGARLARDNGFSGYVPTLEAYSYVPIRPEHDGMKWLVGRRQAPLGVGWVPPDKSPYRELPLRVIRLAYREFGRDPDLTLEAFKARLGDELFGKDATPARVDDALTLQAAINRERDWYKPSPLLEPLLVEEMKAAGKLKPAKAAEYKAAIGTLRGVADRNQGGPGAVGALGRDARWIVDLWAGENASLLDPVAAK